MTTEQKIIRAKVGLGNVSQACKMMGYRGRPALRRVLLAGYANVAPSDSRSVKHHGHGHLVCKFPINVTVPSDETQARQLDLRRRHAAHGGQP